MTEVVAPEASPGGLEAPTRGESIGMVAEPAVADRLLADSMADRAGRSAALDALRAVAALMVVGMHTVIIAPEPDHPHAALHLLRSHLWTGVDLFFALSGFLIAGPFLRALLRGRPLPERTGYVARRIARIVPGYWVALTALVVLVAIGQINLIDDNNNGAGGLAAGSVISHYLFLQNWIPGQSRDLFVVAWTLAIEVLFYLLVPIGAALIRRRYPGPMAPGTLIGIILGLFAASLAWTLAWSFGFDHVRVLHNHVGDWRTVITDNLPAQLGLFCPGMLLAVVFATEASRNPRSLWRRIPSTALMGTAVVVWLVAIAVGGHETRVPQALRDSLLMPIACGFPLLIFLRAGPLVGRLSRWLAPLGVISYGIYLWHWIAAVYLSTHGVSIRAGGQWLDWLIAFAVLCAVTLPISLLSWVVVERPALRRTAAWNARRLRQGEAA